jgi:hypothetical protein
MAKTKAAATPFEIEDSVPIGRIFLALDNPRHEPVENEAQAIERLCTREDVLPLARDIVRHGLSPLERFALAPIGKRSAAQSYYVAEGNRRICALKLLADPDLAPAKFRAPFEKLTANWKPIPSISGVVFKDVDTLNVWLERTHNGPQDGIGRKNWNAEQKQRFSGSPKNRLAQQVLDYAEQEGMITKEQRDKKLTTAQRYLNDVFQEALGIDRTNPDELQRSRPKGDFDAMLRRFMTDLVDGADVHSRQNKPEIVKYARQLSALPGLTTTRIEPEPLSATPPPVRRVRRKPRKPDQVTHVHYDQDIMDALRALGNGKLERLYYSICQVPLQEHIMLIAVGAWSFFETLTACQGRSSTSFDAFLSKGKLSQLGLGSETRSVRTAIGHVSEYGNTTKHHPVSAIFNGDQLNNDMVTLREVILACIADAQAATP